MAIYKEWLLPVASAVVRNGMSGPIYMLGDQECYFKPDYAIKRLRKAGLLRNPAVQIQLRNGLLSARSFFELLGASSYFDIDINDHADHRVDLSGPLPPHLHGAAQTVIDVGTTEHIFNAAKVFENIIGMLQPGGVVMHLSPVSWHNHGFYNFNPLLFNEFYAANGFTRLQHGLLISPLHYPSYTIMNMLGIKYSTRNSWFATPSFVVNDERLAPNILLDNIGIIAKAIFMFVARKEREVRPVIYPVQGLYAGHGNSGS